MKLFRNQKLKIEIGKRIKEVRLKEGLSRKEFLKKIEISKSSFSLFFLEHGLLAPDIDVYYNLFKKLNVSPDWVVTGMDSMYVSDTLDFGEDTEKVLKLIEDFEKYPGLKKDILAFYEKTKAEILGSRKIEEQENGEQAKKKFEG
jgi:transcriptional regulator with XRE-family HTH domain